MFSVDYLLTAIAAAVLGEALYDVFKVPVAVIKTLTQLKRVKPLDCAMCLAFWSGVGFLFGNPIEVVIVWSLVAVLIRQVFYRFTLF